MLSASENLLLASLSAENRELLLPHLTPVTLPLPLRTVLSTLFDNLGKHAIAFL